jgi:Zn-dependent alcohol dehydrogenase
MASLPKTYKAASFQKANEPLSIIDVELKLPAVGEVLVKVLAVGKNYIISYQTTQVLSQPDNSQVYVTPILASSPACLGIHFL